ncbi:MAG TPA: hypothetical protein DCL48_00440 [Alphaproteobacteria bacterium]|nr:hypothetical protein [Alphaproteobacteria bacterium]
MRVARLEIAGGLQRAGIVMLAYAFALYGMIGMQLAVMAELQGHGDVCTLLGLKAGPDDTSQDEGGSNGCNAHCASLAAKTLGLAAAAWTILRLKHMAWPPGQSQSPALIRKASGFWGRGPPA